MEEEAYSGHLLAADHREFRERIETSIGRRHDVVRVPPNTKRAQVKGLQDLCEMLSVHPMVRADEDDDDDGHDEHSYDSTTWCIGAGSLCPRITFLLDAPTRSDVDAFDATDDVWPALSDLKHLKQYSVVKAVIDRCLREEGLKLDRDVAVMFTCPFEMPREEDFQRPGKTRKRQLSKQERETFWTVSRRMLEILHPSVVIAVGKTAWLTLDSSLLWKEKYGRNDELLTVDSSYYTNQTHPVIQCKMDVKMTTVQKRQRRPSWEIYCFFLEHSFYLSSREDHTRVMAQKHWEDVLTYAWETARELCDAAGKHREPRDLAAQLKQTSEKKRKQASAPEPSAPSKVNTPALTPYQNIMAGYLRVKRQRLLIL